MNRIKNYDIAILLFSLLVFSLGIGWVYSNSIKIKNNVQKKENTKKKTPKKSVKKLPEEPPKLPDPPKEIVFKKSDIPEKDDLQTDEIIEYVKEWTSESGIPLLITSLKKMCPKKQIVATIQKIIQEKSDELTRENKIKIILSLANFYKKDKKIQHNLFEIIHQNKTVEKGEIPLIFVAAQQGEKEVIADLIDWYKSLTKKRPDLERKAFEYAAKNDYVKALKALNEKLPIIDKKYATTLLWLAVQQNKGKGSIEFLQKLGANINYQDPKTKHTLLIQAIKNNNIDVVKELVRLGADVKQSSDDKSIGYPLQVARENNFTAIEMFLRSKGAKD